MSCYTCPRLGTKSKKNVHASKVTTLRFSAIMYYLPLQSLEKNEFENFSFRILMPYLSQTFESYQCVRIYTHSVNDLDLKNILQ